MKEKIKNYLKQNWFKTSIIIIAIVMIGSAFYWYGLRTSKIKHDCSWVKIHEDAKAEIRVNQEEYNECVAKQTKDRQKEFKDCEGEINMFCDYLSTICQRPTPAQPEKNWWRKATKNEYDFCIHEKGL